MRAIYIISDISRFVVLVQQTCRSYHRSGEYVEALKMPPELKSNRSNRAPSGKSAAKKAKKRTHSSEEAPATVVDCRLSSEFRGAVAELASVKVASGTAKRSASFVAMGEEGK